MKTKRRLVREDARLLRPKPKLHEVFVFAGGVVDDAIDAAAKASDLAAVYLVDQQLGRITGRDGLLGGEKALLRRCDGEECVAIGALARVLEHAQNVNDILVLCKQGIRSASVSNRNGAYTSLDDAKSGRSYVGN